MNGSDNTAGPAPPLGGFKGEASAETGGVGKLGGSFCFDFFVGRILFNCWHEHATSLISQDV